jgi:hypothetical protein
MVTTTEQSAPQSRIERVMATIAGRIAARSLVAGARLPSCAASPARPACRYRRWSRPITDWRPPAASSRAPARAFTSRRNWRRCSFRRWSPGAIGPSIHFGCRGWRWRPMTAVPKPGCGWLPPDWMPEAALRRGLRQLCPGRNRRASRTLAAITGRRAAAPAAPAARAASPRKDVEVGPGHLIAHRKRAPRRSISICRLQLVARRHRAGRRSLLLQLPGAAEARIRVRLVSVPYTGDRPRSCRLRGGARRREAPALSSPILPCTIPPAPPSRRPWRTASS